MSQTAQQWHDKVEKFVPSWYFEDGTGLADAVFWACSAMMQQIQQDVDDAKAQCFVTTSAAPILDLIGDEENIKRNAGEPDASYAPRIQNGLFISVGLTQLMLFVNSVLNNGTGFFIENEQYGFFDDPDTSSDAGFPYFDDTYTRWLDEQKWYNWWTVIIPVQTGGVDATIQAAIVSAIENNKALGTTYDILYGSPSDTDTDD